MRSQIFWEYLRENEFVRSIVLSCAYGVQVEFCFNHTKGSKISWLCTFNYSYFLTFAVAAVCPVVPDPGHPTAARPGRLLPGQLQQRQLHHAQRHPRCPGRHHHRRHSHAAGRRRGGGAAHQRRLVFGRNAAIREREGLKTGFSRLWRQSDELCNPMWSTKRGKIIFFFDYVSY